MKKSIFFFAVLVTISIVACNDDANEHKGHGKDYGPKSQADSLKKAMDDDHIIGMSKMGRLTRAEQTARRLLDSISQLPSKARKAAEPFRAKLDSLQKELSYAEMAMEKWMRELERDSVINQMEMEEKIKYFSSEQLKGEKVKENILKGLQKADSLIKDKF